MIATSVAPPSPNGSSTYWVIGTNSRRPREVGTDEGRTKPDHRMAPERRILFANEVRRIPNEENPLEASKRALKRYFVEHADKLCQLAGPRLFKYTLEMSLHS